MTSRPGRQVAVVVAWSRDPRRPASPLPGGRAPQRSHRAVSRRRRPRGARVQHHHRDGGARARARRRGLQRDRRPRRRPARRRVERAVVRLLPHRAGASVHHQRPRRHRGGRAPRRRRRGRGRDRAVGPAPEASARRCAAATSTACSRRRTLPPPTGPRPRSSPAASPTGSPGSSGSTTAASCRMPRPLAPLPCCAATAACSETDVLVAVEREGLPERRRHLPAGAPPARGHVPDHRGQPGRSSHPRAASGGRAPRGPAAGGRLRPGRDTPPGAHPCGVNRPHPRSPTLAGGARAGPKGEHQMARDGAGAVRGPGRRCDRTSEHGRMSATPQTARPLAVTVVVVLTGARRRASTSSWGCSCSLGR